MSERNCRVLVTGGAGFIGRHLLWRLVREGADVAGFDVRPWVDAPCPMHATDLRDRMGVMRLLRALRPEIVVHLAGEVGVRSSVSRASETWCTNVTGTSILLAACEQVGVRRFVFASSSSVYGAQTARPSEEDDPLRPRSPYARSKIAAEKLIAAASAQTRVECTILRLFTVYGPGIRKDLALWRFARAISQGEPVTVFGDGTSRRDYTHVVDIVDGFRRAMRRAGPPCLTCNLGTGHPIPVKGVIEHIAQALGRPAKIRYAPVHAADAPHTCAALHRARSHLGYRPTLAFAQGLATMLEDLDRARAS